MIHVVLGPVPKRSGRGKDRAGEVWKTFRREEDFDFPYDSQAHRRTVVSCLMLLTKQKGYFGRKKWKRAYAAMLSKAIAQNRPFLTGFFADQPEWKPRLLKWTEKVLGPESSDSA